MFRLFLFEKNNSKSAKVQRVVIVDSTSSPTKALEMTTITISGYFESLSNRFFNVAKLLLFTTLLFSIPIFSQEAVNSQYSHIKQLIISKQLSKAREEIRLAMAGNENDPTLNLYQTELWIAEGEFYYNSGQYKLALEIYEKAIERYPSNPMVKMKYQEMVNKVKGLGKETKENKPDNSFPIQALGLQGGLPQNSELALRESESPNWNLTMTKTDYLLVVICIQNLVLIVFVFRSHLNKTKLQK